MARVRTLRGPERKKMYREMCKINARKGLINTADGKWATRPAGGNSMMRDYYPQGR